MSFLRVFQSILHALEAAATVAAPIVQAVDPEIGVLMTTATQAAVLVEATVTASGADKAALVAKSTQAGIDLTNQLLVSQGKPPLPAATAGIVAASTKVVVDTLNSVANTVDPAKTAIGASKAVAAAAK